jgi:hypothetical protein
MVPMVFRKLDTVVELANYFEFEDDVVIVQRGDVYIFTEFKDYEPKLGDESRIIAHAKNGRIVFYGKG